MELICYTSLVLFLSFEWWCLLPARIFYLKLLTGHSIIIIIIIIVDVLMSNYIICDHSLVNWTIRTIILCFFCSFCAKFLCFMDGSSSTSMTFEIFIRMSEWNRSTDRDRYKRSERERGYKILAQYNIYKYFATNIVACGRHVPLRHHLFLLVSL